MNFYKTCFIGKEEMVKTSLLFHYIYDDLRNEDSSEYAFFITNESNKHLEKLLFGKYSIVTKDVLDRIKIKYINTHLELITFLFDLESIHEYLQPKSVAIDRINSYLDVPNPANRTIYEALKLEDTLSYLVSNKIRFYCSFDIDLENEDFIYRNYIMQVLNDHFMRQFIHVRLINNSYKITKLQLNEDVTDLKNLTFITQSDIFSEELEKALNSYICQGTQMEIN